MTFLLTNGNHIKVHKVLEINVDKTYVEFTHYQKYGNWKLRNAEVFQHSMYDNVTDYLQSKYSIK